VTVILGQIAPPGSTGPPDVETFQVGTGASSPSYAVPPGNWTVTSWSVRGGSVTSTAALQAWRPTPGADQHTLVAESDTATLPPGSSAPFATSIAVQEGDVLGVDTESGDIADFVSSGVTGDILRRVSPDGSDPDLGQTVGSPGDFSYSQSGGRVNVAATVAGPDPEPEAGDTKPPDTKILKGPKRTTHKRKAKLRFGSSEPAGAAFLCALDGRGTRPCDSPEKVRVGRGQHRFEVQAIDAAGNIDPTPDERRWKVKRKDDG
jgi:hypothetical protein